MSPSLPPAFLKAPIAHRAYHDVAQGRPENSRAAIRAALPSLMRASRLDTNAAISACVGFFSFFGGISPEFTCSITSAQ